MRTLAQMTEDGDAERRCFGSALRRPAPEWVRGQCPVCGDDLVSNLYYVPNRGYVLAWECWGSQHVPVVCRYRKIL